MSVTLNKLLRICLVQGVEVTFPERVSDSYRNYKMPYRALSYLSKEGLQKYVKALTEVSFEEAYHWSKGHELLEELGFERHEEEAGHRVFVSYKYKFSN